MFEPRKAGPSGKKMDAMQVTETLVEGLKHEFQISVPASDLDAKADVKLVELKDKVKLNGFRPGKVPVSHLKKVYGRSVMAETIDQTIRDTNTQIFTERGFRLATEPKISMPTEAKEVEDILSGKSDLTYTVSIEGAPALKLGVHIGQRVNNETDRRGQALVDRDLAHEPILGGGPAFEVGQLFVVDDDEDIIVGLVAADRIIDPVAAR